MLEIALACAASVAGIWLAYPLAIGFAARVVRRRASGVPPDSLLPSVSVILATRDANDSIRERVIDLVRTEYPHDRLEVIVALDATRNGSEPPAFTDMDVPVRIVAGDDPGGKAASLNAGVRVATGDVLVFADTAQRFAPDAIPRLATALTLDPRMGAVSGALQIGTDGRPASVAELYWRFERWLRREEAKVHSAVGVTGAIYAQRRSTWEPLPAGLILDDLFGPMRLVLNGWRIGFCEEARAVDERRFVTEKEYARKVRTLTGNLQLCAWLPGVLLPVRNPIWLQFVCHKLLRLLTPYIVLVGILAAAIAFSSVVTRTMPRSTSIVLVAIGAFVVLAPAFNRKLRSVLIGGLAMQAAVVHATINGIRGRWDVWNR